MLNSIGGECAGGVSVLSSGETPTVKYGYRELNEEELHKVIIDLPRRPLMAGLEGMRLSLAAFQRGRGDQAQTCLKDLSGHGRLVHTVGTKDCGRVSKGLWNIPYHPKDPGDH